MRRALVMVMLSMALAGRGEAREPQLREQVAARNDPSETYTLYLPSSYDEKKPAPLLFVFDPRGRATAAAGFFRDGAETFGWIVISANGTRSDESPEPNLHALRALLPEAERYNADPNRIYAAGFSGTAMLAWTIGITTGRLAGVIGVGGRSIDELPPRKFNFAHYGFAGIADFNNREMRRVDAALDREGKTHRFTQFDGVHRWMTPELAREAIGWLEVIAMKEQRRPRDEQIIAAELGRDRAAAEALERGGSLLDAMRRYHAIAQTYGDAAARDAAARLERDARVQRALADEAKWDEFETLFTKQVFGNTGAIYAAAREERSARHLAADFRVAELQKRAQRGGAEAAAARRLLEAVFGQTSFYLPRQLAERGEHALAAATIAVATEIHPENPNTWYALAAAQARAGDRRRALDALAKAFANGFSDKTHLAADEAFAALRSDPRFQQFLASPSQ
ncbi:MAG TPA: hypothetical protein VF824_12830 [Thermoanaerobaculia bacterium]